MSAILKKENIKTYDVVCQKISQTNAECDVIVPDINPDILTVLDISGFVTVSEKVIRGNKAYIKGTAHMTMLYLPDGDVLSAVKSLSAAQEFNHSIDIGLTNPNLVLSCEVEPEGFSHILINSRKVSLKASIGIGIKVLQFDDFNASTSCVSDDDLICTETKNIRICDSQTYGESRILLSQMLEIPDGKPCALEILKTTATAESIEFSLLENKASVKGQVKICILYTSLLDGSVKFAEYIIPFSEILNVEGAEEDMEGEIDYSITDIYSEIRDDADGEPNIFGLEIGICAAIRGYKIYEIDIISDAYSLKGNENISFESSDIELLLDNTTAQLTDKSTVNIPEHLPPIFQICDINTVASVDNLSAKNGEITLSGKILSTILYLTDDPNLPLGSFKAVSDFSHTTSASFATDDTICDAKVYTEHTSYTLNGDRSIDLRTILGISIKSFKKENVATVSDIEIKDEESKEAFASIVIYFVKKGDTLFKIAKRFKTTVDALKACNNIEGDLIYPNQQIRICR